MTTLLTTAPTSPVAGKRRVAVSRTAGTAMTVDQSTFRAATLISSINTLDTMEKPLNRVWIPGAFSPCSPSALSSAHQV